MPKTKLTHRLPNGRTFTRTTARDYTHVVVVRDERERDFAAEYAYLAEQPERMAGAIKYAEERAAEHRDDVVLSWHGSAPLAAKAAEQARKRGWTHARVEAITGA